MNTTEHIWIKVIQQLNNNEKPDQQLMAKLSTEERELIQALEDDKMLNSASNFIQKMNENDAWNEVKPKLPIKTVRFLPQLLRYAAILLLPILLLGGGIFYYIKSNQPVELSLAKLEPTDHNRATLVLSDGRSVELSKNENQKLSEIAGTSITNKNKELLSYQQDGNANATEQIFNKLIIPRGAEYKLALADGTVVMINSASVLRFPVNINATNSRNVYLEQGEAYFKVAKNPNKPFIVHANGMDVRVLGTTFNVNTYTKTIRTTLVEGRVEAQNANNQKVILSPNEQAIFNQQTNALTKADVDVAPFVAWANGKIIYEESTLDEVMQTLSLWYDYDVEFKSDKIKAIHFSGEIERYKDIKTILNIIEQTGGVKFSIKNRRIYVDQR
ncbi:FecR family protein [Pedobacter fastidiosus]|uniref:FecR family protein n=1 Tax=Pedobacter fastidiosus TaxID=2765361 RepID=A0ABR7KW55_9SPHI|nr:FecR family protein [Pedobacter fastidiosus]MBC6112055.1 FecR family protein [Pedobacter fastidiosus]